MMKLTNAEQIPGTDVHLVFQIVHQADSNRDNYLQQQNMKNVGK
jgi:hypothetical protein